MNILDRMQSLVSKLKQAKLLKRMIFGFTIIMIVTLSVAYLINFEYMSSVLADKHHQKVLNKMEQMNEKIGLFTQTIDSFAKYLLSNNDVIRLSKRANPDSIAKFDDYLLYSKILRDLENLKNENTYINSIYIYTQDQFLLGSAQGRRFARRIGSEIPIVKTEFYKILSASPYRLMWTDGLSETAFSNSPNIFITDEPELLTVGMSRVDLYGGDRILVILNIKASNLAQFYDPYLDVGSDTIYIVNENNIVISSNETNAVGNVGIYDISTLEGKTGQFFASKSGEKSQVMYYKMDKPGWYIIIQTPQAVYHNDIYALQQVINVIFITTFFITIFFLIFWSVKAVSPLQVLCSRMDAVGKGHFGVQIDIHPKNEIGDAIKNFNIMSANLAMLAEQNKVIEQQRREQELKALRAQINPHFLYNTLNTIKVMAIMQNADNVADCIVSLAEILQPVFKSGSELIPLKDEIGFQQSYIKILNYRLKNTIMLDIDFDEQYNNILVPRFTLQPLIENSIQHGRYTADQDIHIRISITEAGEDLVIAVHDDGQGFTAKKLQEITSLLQKEWNEYTSDPTEKIGIYNVNKRIQLHYGKQYGLRLENDGAEGGTAVLIRIPRNQPI